MEKEFDNIIIGAGIAGCSVAHFLNKYNHSILLIDKNKDVANGASGAAGAFLSPLLGKPNNFKNLVKDALLFSINYYKKNFNNEFKNFGTCRIPKDNNDDYKFISYIPYFDFDYKKVNNGYFFPVGSLVNPYQICKKLSKDINKLFNYEITTIKNINNHWIINNEYRAKSIFLCTGADISLINEEYFNIREVWGQKIDILTSSKVDINYHKECSISTSEKVGNKNLVSIGATHHRFDYDMSKTSYNIKLKNINEIKHDSISQDIIDNDTKQLLKKANNILSLKDIEIADVKIGARASSIDYFPMVGLLVDSKKNIKHFPHIVNGSFIQNEKLLMFKNLYTLNGLGGRGFTLSLYLAKCLVENIVNNKKLNINISNYRLFSRWIRRKKFDKYN